MHQCVCNQVFVCIMQSPSLPWTKNNPFSVCVTMSMQPQVRASVCVCALFRLCHSIMQPIASLLSVTKLTVGNISALFCVIWVLSKAGWNLGKFQAEQLLIKQVQLLKPETPTLLKNLPLSRGCTISYCSSPAPKHCRHSTLFTVKWCGEFRYLLGWKQLAEIVSRQLPHKSGIPEC